MFAPMQPGFIAGDYALPCIFAQSARDHLLKRAKDLTKTAKMVCFMK